MTRDRPEEGGASRFRTLRWDLLVPALFGVVALIVTALWNRSTVDDAYISFRYLDNWLAGHGLVFNPGERVEGYSNLLWILLLAPLRLAGLEPELAADALAALALALTAWASARTAEKLTSSRVAGAATLALLGGAAPLAAWTFSGMETLLFTALLSLAACSVASCGRFDARAGALFGLAALTRPEGIAVGLLAFLALTLRDSRATREEWAHRLAGLGALICLPTAQALWRLSYYGSLLPNTYYAKLGGVSSTVALREGFSYVLRFASDGGLLLLLAAALAVLSPLRFRPAALHLWALVGATFGFAVRAGGDYFPCSGGRRLLPLQPLPRSSPATAGGAWSAGPLGARSARSLETDSWSLGLARPGGRRDGQRTLDGECSTRNRPLQHGGLPRAPADRRLDLVAGEPG